MKTTARASAKVNLVLGVGPPSSTPPKGYHPICSWFSCVDLCDEIELERLEGGAPSRYELAWTDDAPRPTPIDWPIDKDLGVRAHRLMEELAGENGTPRALPVAMRVTKRIPVGGGLGGGSSDAAAVMLAVNELYALNIPVEHLRVASAKLGADVAFFLDEPAPASPPRPALVRGFGDRVERVERVQGRLVLVFPPFGCATAGVYAAFDRDIPAAQQRPFDDASQRIYELLATAREHGLARVSDQLWNDLALPACAVEPRLGAMLATLRGNGLAAHVTGSGSTLFVVVRRGGELSRVRSLLGGDAVAIETELL